MVSFVPLLLAPLLAAAPTPPPAGCPAAAVAVIDGLYRWHVANDSGPMQLSSQRQRFTAELYGQLLRAEALTPAEGAFLDFDVFSGTQVGTYGATVTSCRGDGAGLMARVAVQAGLRGRPAERPVLLDYSLQQDRQGRWRIADITYSWEPAERLSAILGQLLRSATPASR